MRVPHAAISAVELSDAGLLVAITVANTPSDASGGWVRISHAHLQARLGWTDLGGSAAGSRIQRAVASAIAAGFLERSWITTATTRVPRYRVTTAWSAATFEPLPRTHLPTMIGLGAGAVRHWLLLRMFAGRAGSTEAPISADCRYLGVAPATARRQRQALAQAGLIEVQIRHGYASRIVLADVHTSASNHRGTPTHFADTPPHILRIPPSAKCVPSSRRSFRQTSRQLGASSASTAPQQTRELAAAGKPPSQDHAALEQRLPLDDVKTAAQESSAVIGVVSSSGRVVASARDRAAKSAAGVVLAHRGLAMAPGRVRGQVRQRLASWLRRPPAGMQLDEMVAEVNRRLTHAGPMEGRECQVVDEVMRGLWADLKAATAATDGRTTTLAPSPPVTTPHHAAQTLEVLAGADVDPVTDPSRWIAAQVAGQILTCPDRDPAQVAKIGLRWWDGQLTTHHLESASLAIAAELVDRAITATTQAGLLDKTLTNWWRWEVAGDARP